MLFPSGLNFRYKAFLVSSGVDWSRPALLFSQPILDVIPIRSYTDFDEEIQIFIKQLDAAFDTIFAV